MIITSRTKWPRVKTDPLEWDAAATFMFTGDNWSQRRVRLNGHDTFLKDVFSAWQLISLNSDAWGENVFPLIFS